MILCGLLASQSNRILQLHVGESLSQRLTLRPRKTGQRWRVLAALSEELSSVPSIYSEAYSCLL